MRQITWNLKSLHIVVFYIDRTFSYSWIIDIIDNPHSPILCKTGYPRKPRGRFVAKEPSLFCVEMFCRHILLKKFPKSIVFCSFCILELKKCNLKWNSLATLYICISSKRLIVTVQDKYKYVSWADIHILSRQEAE